MAETKIDLSKAEVFEQKLIGRFGFIMFVCGRNSIAHAAGYEGSEKLGEGKIILKSGELPFKIYNRGHKGPNIFNLFSGDRKKLNDKLNAWVSKMIKKYYVQYGGGDGAPVVEASYGIPE